MNSESTELSVCLGEEVREQEVVCRLGLSDARAASHGFVHLASERIEIGACVKIFKQRFQLNKTKTSKLVFVFEDLRGRRP
jgi:hypothetical protein